MVFSDSNYTIIWGSSSYINLNNVILTNNYATSPGGIFLVDFDSDLNLNNCSVINNCINYSGGISGGIIFANSSDVNIVDSIFDNNTVLATIYAGGFIFARYGDFNFINSTISNVFINATDVSGGIFYSKGNLKINHSSISNVNINASAIYGGFGYISQTNNLNEVYLLNSYFSNSNFTDIYGLFYTRTASKFENVTISYNYAETIEGNFIIYDVYNLSSVVDFSEYGNDFNNIAYNLSEIGNIVYMNDVFSSNITLPASYDLRNMSLVTSVKNQKDSGCCWAFASIASLESYLLKYWNVSYDLSENNMKNIMGKYAINGSEYDTNDGGNDFLALAYLLRWSGAVLESDDPYNDSSTNPTYGLDAICHVQGVVYIPLRKNYTDNDQIKQAIMKYGALFSTLSTSTDIYQMSSNATSPNHAIAIVGWDDNYPGSNFGPGTPDGAFIIKNSWGTSSGDKGYYYISYYAPSFAGLGWNIGYSAIAFTNVENTGNYDNIYQYDIFGNNGYTVGFSSNEGWCANKFTANNEESLSAFGFYTYGDSNFTAYIYVNDELVYTQNGSIIGGGYNTIKLNNDIIVKKGDTFKIVINLSTANYLYPIAIEEYVEDKYNATANPDESFVSSDGVNWIDLTEYYPNANVCIKAYTKSLDKSNVYIPEYFNGTVNDSVDLTAYVFADKYDCNGTLTFYIDGVEIATVNVTDGIASYKYIPKSVGIFNIKAVYNGDSFHKSSTNTSSLVVSKSTVFLAINRVGDYYKSIYITLTLSNGASGEKIVLKFNNSKTVTLTTNSKGIAIYYVPFAVGVYNVTATLISDNYESNNATIYYLKISKASATLYASSLSTTYKSGSYFQVKVLNSKKQAVVGASIQLKVYTGKSYKTVTLTTNSYGIAKYYCSSLSIGQHKVIISSKESSKNMVASSKTAYITIKKAPVLIVAPVVKNKYKSNKYFTITIKNKATNAVISGLSFKVSVYTGKKAKTYTLKTNSKGIAYLNTKYLSIGTHKVVIKVSTSYYYGSKTGNLIVITK